MINKDLVKNSFKKNLKTYDENALVQKKMAEKLIKLIADKKFDKVLEIGIGTGFFTKLLAEKINCKEFYANDIVSECSHYLSKVIKGAFFVSGDIESVNIPDKLDLVVSNAAFQWVSNLEEMLVKIQTSLNKDGIFIFSTFGDKNFLELKEVANIGLNYLSLSQLERLTKKYFDIVEINEEQEEVCFDSFKDVLKHIKLTGVNGVSDKRFTVSELKDMGNEYSKKFKRNKSFILTYNPIYVHLKKKT